MAIARLYVDGESWEISGDVKDSFLPYENSLEASRSGKIYATTEARARTVSVDTIFCQLEEFDQIVKFLEGCNASTNGFTVTVAIGEDCQEPYEVIYTGCLISGTPEFSPFNKKIESFEFGYSNRTVKKG